MNEGIIIVVVTTNVNQGLGVSWRLKRYCHYLQILGMEFRSTSLLHPCPTLDSLMGQRSLALALPSMLKLCTK